MTPGGVDSLHFVRRVKPYCQIPENESTFYAYLSGFDLQCTPCPYSTEAMRNDIRSFLNKMELKRPGTKFSVEVKDSSKTTILIPFDAGLSGNYDLEFGDLYMRVHKSAGIVVENDIVITGITQANPAVVTVSGTAPLDGQCRPT